METKQIELTTDHPSSSYGIPVLLIDGEAYGPSDSIEHTEHAEAGGAAGTAGYYVAAAANRGEFDTDQARLFCSQWPQGPQPD